MFPPKKKPVKKAPKKGGKKPTMPPGMAAIGNKMMEKC